jgi:hypothetical protein
VSVAAPLETTYFPPPSSPPLTSQSPPRHASSPFLTCRHSTSFLTRLASTSHILPPLCHTRFVSSSHIFAAFHRPISFASSRAFRRLALAVLCPLYHMRLALSFHVFAIFYRLLSVFLRLTRFTPSSSPPFVSYILSPSRASYSSLDDPAPYFAPPISKIRPSRAPPQPRSYPRYGHGILRSGLVLCQLSFSALDVPLLTTC